MTDKQHNEQECHQVWSEAS